MLEVDSNIQSDSAGNVYNRLLSANPLEIMKNREILSDFLSKFQSILSPEEDYTAFARFRHDFYNNLALNPALIEESAKSTLITKQSIHSLEAFTRTLFEFCQAMKITPPILQAKELAAVIQGDATAAVSCLIRLFGLPVEGDYLLRLQGKLALASTAARFMDEMLYTFRNVLKTDSSRAAAVEAGFIIAEQCINESISQIGARVYDDSFADKLALEANPLASNMPGKIFMLPKSQAARMQAIIDAANSRWITLFLEKFLNPTPDKPESVLELEGDNSSKLKIYDTEAEREVEIPTLEGMVSTEAKDQALQAGKTIIDYLRNLKLGDDLGDAGRDASEADDENEQEVEPENEQPLGLGELIYEIMVDNRKRKAQKDEIISILLHGQQQVHFIAQNQLKHFNQSTHGKFSTQIRLYPASQQQGRGAEIGRVLEDALGKARDFISHKREAGRRAGYFGGEARQKAGQVERRTHAPTQQTRAERDRSNDEQGRATRHASRSATREQRRHLRQELRTTYVDDLRQLAEQLDKETLERQEREREQERRSRSPGRRSPQPKVDMKLSQANSTQASRPSLSRQDAQSLRPTDPNNFLRR